MDARVRLLADGLAHDLADIDGWEVELRDSDGVGPSDEASAKLHLAVDLRFVDGVGILLEFYPDEDFANQAVDALQQVQDLVVETSLVAWPACPTHSHALGPVNRRDDLFWVCPTDADVLTKVGEFPGIL